MINISSYIWWASVFRCGCVSLSFLLIQRYFYRNKWWKMDGSCSGVACFAIYRFIDHLNLWKRIDKQGVRSEHLNNRFFTMDLNGITIDKSQFTPRHWDREFFCPQDFCLGMRFLITNKMFNIFLLLTILRLFLTLNEVTESLPSSILCLGDGVCVCLLKHCQKSITGY